MSLIATRLQNWRVENPELDRNMARQKEYGALDFFIEQTNAANSILSPELIDRAFASMGNTVQVPVINYDSSVEVSNVRSCVIGDDENTSALYTVVFATYAVGFTMVPAAYMNNEITYQHDFQRKMDKICRAMGTALDSAAVAALEAQKTQVFADPLQYNVVANVIDVPTQMATEVLGDMNPIMRANDYPQTIHIIGNAGIDSLVRKLAQHDVYNDVNKRMEYDNKILHYSNQVTNAAGKNGTFFAVADGNCGILTRVDREALRRTRANFHEWDVVRLPYIDLPMGSHYYTAVGDQSAIAGDATADLTCAVKEYFGFSVDVAFVVAYNNDLTTIANPIIKAAIDAQPQNRPIAMPTYVVNLNEAASIVLNKATTSIAVGGNETLVATTAPNAYVVSWSSDDTAVATVDATGKVVGVAAGTANITASISVYGVTYTASCEVTVA